ncbi:MAG: hypothetical protein R3A79_23215 [Nannocystaceae bacterium]
MSISRPALVAALALAPACAESPSVELRWRILPPAEAGFNDEALPLTSIRQCTEVGIGRVRLTTRAGGLPIDVREFPCFPDDFDDAGALAPGPELPAGTYELTLEGLRRSTQETWSDDLVSVSAEVTIAGGAPIPLDDLILPAPPTCDDGVDNDRDGFVDAGDIDCRVSDPTESNQVTTVQFFVEVSFLDQSPYAISCGTLGIANFLVRVDGDPESDRLIRCDEAGNTTSFSRRVDPDPNLNPHVVTITGLDLGGATATVTKEIPFEVFDAQDKPVEAYVDFAGADLVEPLIAGLDFIVAFASEEDDDAPRYCVDAGSALEIAEVGIAVVALTADGMGGFTETPVDPAVLVDGGALDGQALDGAPLACQSSRIISEALDWSDGSYGLQITGRSAEGEVCFATDEAIRAAPQGPIEVVVPRVSSEGSCAD